MSWEELISYDRDMAYKFEKEEFLDAIMQEISLDYNFINQVRALNEIKSGAEYDFYNEMTKDV